MGEGTPTAVAAIREAAYQLSRALNALDDLDQPSDLYDATGVLVELVEQLPSLCRRAGTRAEQFSRQTNAYDDRQRPPHGCGLAVHRDMLLAESHAAALDFTIRKAFEQLSHLGARDA